MEDVNTRGYIFIFLPKPSCLIIKLPFISQNMPASKEFTPAQSIDDMFYIPCVGCGMTESFSSELVMSSTTNVITTAVTSILIVLCIIGNSLVCVVVKKNHDMRSVHNNT